MTHSTVSLLRAVSPSPGRTRYCLFVLGTAPGEKNPALMRACACVSVSVCMRLCVCARVSVCVRACVRVSVCVCGWVRLCKAAALVPAQERDSSPPWVPLSKRAWPVPSPYLLWGVHSQGGKRGCIPYPSMGTGVAPCAELGVGQEMADRPRDVSPLFCPALVWTQMIESGCFKDINEDEPEENMVLNVEEKMYHSVPKPKRGFFCRLFRRGVRVTSILLFGVVFFF